MLKTAISLLTLFVALGANASEEMVRFHFRGPKIWESEYHPDESQMIQAVTVSSASSLQESDGDTLIRPQIQRRFAIKVSSQDMLPGEYDSVDIHFDGVHDWVVPAETNTYRYQSSRQRRSDGVVQYTLTPTERLKTMPPNSANVVQYDGAAKGFPGFQSNAVIFSYSDALCDLIAKNPNYEKMGTKTTVRFWSSKSGVFHDTLNAMEYHYTCGDAPIQIDLGLKNSDKYHVHYEVFRTNSTMFTPDQVIGGDHFGNTMIMN